MESMPPPPEIPEELSAGVDPERSTPHVLMLYGATMLAVQGLENTVSFLYLIANTDPLKASNASPERQLRSTWDRLWSSFQKGTAGMKLNDAKVGVKPHIDGDLYDELDAFVKGPRAQLAHRFLIERIREGKPFGRFVPGSVLYLLSATQQATSLTSRLNERTMEILASWPESERPPQEMQDFAVMISGMAMRKDFPSDLLGSDAGNASPPAEE